MNNSAQIPNFLSAPLLTSSTESAALIPTKWTRMIKGTRVDSLPSWNTELGFQLTAKVMSVCVLCFQTLLHFVFLSCYLCVHGCVVWKGTYPWNFVLWHISHQVTTVLKLLRFCKWEEGKISTWRSKWSYPCNLSIRESRHVHHLERLTEVSLTKHLSYSCHEIPLRLSFCYV